jgi:chaperonin GroEL
MAKQVSSEKETKEALLRGVNKLANAVGSTLGAAGKTVIISHYHGMPPLVSKDGVTVCNAISLEDETENVGAELIKGAARQTVIDCGDSTTTSTILAQSIINQGFRAVDSGSNSQELKSGIDKAVANVSETLKSLSTPIVNNDDIRNVATISANNDSVIGNLIADVYSKIGNEGVLLVKENKTPETTIEVAEGVEIDRGFISPEFANNKEKITFEAVDAHVLICDYTLASFVTQIVPLLQKMEIAGIVKEPLVIIANDFEGEVYGSILMNVKKKSLNACLMTPPNTYRNETMEDIAVLTGATVISDRNGLKMENALVEHLGKTPKIIVSEQKTVIYGGGDPIVIAEHKHAVKVQMEDMKDEALKEIWRVRLGKISGAMGIISVGGSTPVEMKERKDRVDDACRAVKCAIEEGVVVGGGIALIRCMENLSKADTLIGDEKIGWEIIRKSCEVPLKKMLSNAGLDEARILPDVKRDIRQNWGYNVKTKEFQDLLKNGVIDPTKVVRCALQNAASVAGAIITSDYSLIEMKVK